MGIQINGITDTILATDGSLVVSGQQLTGVTDISASGIVTATQGYVVGTGASIFSPAANTLALGTNGSERIRITSAGFMGLGMASPSAPLDVVTGSSGAIFRYSSASTWLHLLPGDANGNIALRFRANSGNAPDLLFQNDAGTEIARITNSGRLAIGTTPQEVLDVNGRGRFQGSASSAVSGSGLELAYVSGSTTGQILTYNRSTSAYLGTNIIGNPLTFSIGGSEAARIDTSSRLLVGTSSVISNGYGGTAGLLQVAKNDYLPIGFFTYSNTAGETGYCPYVELNRARGTQASPSAVSSGDDLGIINFYGYDSSTFSRAAYIKAVVDGGVSGAGDMPGRLVFSTTADGASSPTERMRIKSAGHILHSCAAQGDWGLKTQNIGNNSLNYGISILCGTDAATGTNYAVEFLDGDGTAQGYITFTSGTVTYGAFTAHHPCILPEADNEAGYPYGTLLETTSIEYTQKDGHNTERGILYNVRKTQAANSRAVLGAYGSSMNGGPNGETNRHQALVLGDGHILCNNFGGNIKVGDGICSSATPGIGQKATATPSMAIGIAQEDVTFAADEEVKLVAVQYGVRQFIPWGD